MSKHNNPQHPTTNTIISLWSDLHSQKQKLWLPVLSGSMLPLLRIGDKVLVQSAKPDNIKIGDIVVFKDNDKLVVHRVIQKYESDKLSFLQKGDNTRISEIISGEEIVGKVTAIRRNKRTICLNKGIWKMWNYFIACFYCAPYFLRPQNQVLRIIAKFFFSITKTLLKRIIMRI